jgi:hypothetical protein
MNIDLDLETGKIIGLFWGTIPSSHQGGRMAAFLPPDRPPAGMQWVRIGRA